MTNTQLLIDAASFAITFVHLRITLCTCSNSYGGGGLLGKYYTDTRITNTAAYTSRIDAGINFNWGIGAVGPTLATDNAAVRYATCNNYACTFIRQCLCNVNRIAFGSVVCVHDTGTYAAAFILKD